MRHVTISAALISIVWSAFAQTVPSSIEQRAQGARPAAIIAESFDGLGFGFTGPQGTTTVRNPSDNSLAVGPDHIVQIVNSRTAIFSRKGKKFETTGKALYGPVNTNNVFKGFGGSCEARQSGDAVVRYDQVADRWLIVMPLFSRGPVRPDQPEPFGPADGARASVIGVPGQPGKAETMFVPPPPPPPPPVTPGDTAGRGR